MNSGLVALGILALVGMFFIGNIIITPQQRNQVELASGICGSFWGKLGGALSPEVAEECRKAQTAGQILSLEPFIYIVGFGLIVLGLALPSRKKEVQIIREVIKEPVKELEHEPEIKSKKRIRKRRKVKYCSNCGAKVRGKFCGKCGRAV